MSDEVRTIDVSLGPRSYRIAIGSGLLEQLGNYVQQWTAARHAVVISDSNVQPLYGDAAVDQLVRSGIKVSSLVVPAGEPSKSVAEADRLWQAMLAGGADRRSVVVAVGGGVVGDLAGFVAATYARGVALVQVPTSLLAQVDSSVGGKVGINLPGAKNMVGAFWQPRGVLIDVATLRTLPERQYRAGLAEVVKYGVILDAGFFQQLEQNAQPIRDRDAAVLTAIVARCCRLKADVVERDEREESGLRAVLNYGHTFAHAIEAVSGYGEYLHGEAVAMGMMCAARLAERLGRVDAAFVARQRSLLQALGLPVEPPPLDVDQLVAAMHHDKKTVHGRLRFVLPARLGQVETVDGVPIDLVRAACTA